MCVPCGLVPDSGGDLESEFMTAPGSDFFCTISHLFRAQLVSHGGIITRAGRSTRYISHVGDFGDWERTPQLHWVRIAADANPA